MPTKSKETPTVEKSATKKSPEAAKKTAQESKQSTKATSATAKKSTAKSSAKKASTAKQTATKQKTQSKAPQAAAVQEELIIARVEDPVANSPAVQTPSQLPIDDGTNFRAADLIKGEMWTPNADIPGLDEKSYAAQKAQAESQRRAIEVAKLNLQNINDMHQLERESINVAISAKENETRNAQLAGTDIDYQTQLEMNGAKSQQLAQAASRHQAAVRETGYTDQLIDLKDQNFELEIQQAQSVFAEKAARYRAQLTGGE